MNQKDAEICDILGVGRRQQYQAGTEHTDPGWRGGGVVWQSKH